MAVTVGSMLRKLIPDKEIEAAGLEAVARASLMVAIRCREGVLYVPAFIGDEMINISLDSIIEESEKGRGVGGRELDGWRFRKDQRKTEQQ